MPFSPFLSRAWSLQIPDTYRFALTTCLLPRIAYVALMQAATMPRYAPPPGHHSRCKSQMYSPLTAGKAARGLHTNHLGHVRLATLSLEVVHGGAPWSG